ncbi:LuxR C-terminal-related transcriptional regulator [Specibacter sp. NPDC057265]|uniref:LuxR C-terminal-related transcriptional regulator n=1 Tax=Specibacter sp. NPDC057265 TaxID=3346075 RepID=UPI00362E8098
MRPPDGGGDIGPDAAEILQPPFCRGDELGDILSIISGAQCRAVFLTADSGLGASTLLRRVVSEVKTRLAVIAVHGTLSLAQVPYGVLAPFMRPAGGGHLNIGISVLHSLLQEIERRRKELPAAAQAGNYPALIVIDDAHFLDVPTAEVLVKLVMSGTANLVLSHASKSPLPAPLPKLWATGMAENITLKPLSMEAGHVFCELMLGGQVRRATSWQFCSAAAGNPLLLRIAVEAAVKNGQLMLHNGWWVAAPHLLNHGRVLDEVVRAQLRDLSDAGRAALNLVALSEPVEESTVHELWGSAALAELRERRLVRRHHQDAALLALASPIYGDVIREMVPLGQRRRLYEQLTHRGGHEELGSEALLRRVLWALEVGADIPEEQILRAAIFAVKLFQSATALQLVAAIRGSEFRVRAGMVKARAKYNMGDYRGALAAMESLSDDAGNLVDLLFGSLLRAATRSALGMPVQAIANDARALREGGERLALKWPDQAHYIAEHSRKHALLLTLVVHSRAGSYAQMGPQVRALVRSSVLATAYDKLYRAVALTMDVERLTAQGFPLQGLLRVKEALAIERSDEDDVFLLPESIIFRHLLAATCAGEWQEVAAVLERVSVEAELLFHSIGGGADVVRGMMLLRCGKTAEALDALVAGMDALKTSDPQQLLGCCTAMASYAAARLGRMDLARRLARDHVADSGMFVVVAHGRAYLSACRHLLRPGSGALAELLAQADEARAADSTMLELNALVLVLELGDCSVAARVAEIAAAVEGPWARSVQDFAAAVLCADGLVLARAAQQLADAGLLGLARQALAWAATALQNAAASPAVNNAHKQLRQLAPTLGMQAPARHLGAQAPQQRLTRREREVTVLVASGLGDREVAEKLNLSLRTVEGHLYRAYGKLGIRARTELPAALAQLPPQQ